MKSVISAVLCVGIAILSPLTSPAALVLPANSYNQSFDGIGSGLPTGWTVNTGATISGNGSAVSFTTSALSWANTGGDFKNLASSEGLVLTSDSTAQGASTDRALGIRQTGSFGDPGAAIILEIANTVGLENFELSLKLQMLDIEDRSTAWTLDYRVGNSGSFTGLDTYGDPGAFGSTTVSFDSDDLADWVNQSDSVWFRVVALTGSTGSNNRDTFAIDDFSLSYSEIAPVPELDDLGLIFALGSLGVCGFHSWRQRRRALPLT